MNGPGRHVLLGAGGPVSVSLARALLARREDVRLVSRRGFELPDAEVFKADLLDPAAVQNAVLPGSTAYLLAGLRYRSATWAREWPQVMANAIEACATRDARLVFFDNVYLYGRVTGPMTEETPVNPCSRKGEIRARIAEYLLQSVKAGRLDACIARSADFYGPGAGGNSVPELLVFRRLAAGKVPQWPGDAGVPHSLTYTPDCGPALVLLAEAPDAWGKVWHLPTAYPPLTGRQFVNQAAAAFGRPPDVSVLRPWMVGLIGAVVPTVGEIREMLYQNTAPYVFDSSKFQRRFGVSPTSYADGIAASAAAWRA